jgi:hypothetical protein
MNTLTSLTITALILACSANANAQTSSSGLTRAEVRAQLVQAEKDGILPYGKLGYPPSDETIARNKALYDIRHKHVDSDATAATQQDASGVNSTVN